MKEALFYHKSEGQKVDCFLCNHRCRIPKGTKGICGVRINQEGTLYSLNCGKVIAAHIDPIEKKPLFHFLPGSQSYSIACIGCNFKCDFCQNFEISQISKRGNILGKEISPEEIVKRAIQKRCKSISYTYNEPAIFIEFVRDIAKIAKKKGLKNILVTNGYLSKECFDYIKDYIDAMNIDLKSFNDKFYVKYCGGNLKPVLETIKRAYEKGIHIELTTLIIPTLNDSEKEFKKIAKFIASVNKNIAWHVTRFFPMYKMPDKKITPLDTLRQAEKIGKKYLNYVHVGNV